MAEVSSRKNSAVAETAPSIFDLSAVRAALAEAERKAQERLTALSARKRSTQVLAAGAKWAQGQAREQRPFVPSKQLLLYLVR